MIKTLLRILGTAFFIVALFDAQHYIQQYYNFDPRLWFFVEYGLFVFCLCIIPYAVNPKSKNTQNEFTTCHSMDSPAENGTTDIRKASASFTSVFEEIVNSSWYTLICLAFLFTSLAGLLYKFYFYDDFMARTTAYTIWLAIIALNVLIRTIMGMFTRYTIQRIFSFLCSIIWVLLFFLNYNH